MPRYTLTIPDDLMAAVNNLCDDFGFSKSRFITRGIMMALDDARNRFGEASNDPVRAPSPGAEGPTLARGAKVLSPRPETADVEFEIGTVKRGDTVWFDMGADCLSLQIETESLRGEIDGEDDVLNYAGRDWIDGDGVKHALALSRDEEASEKLRAWAQSKT